MRQSNQNGAPASLDACCCVSVHMIFLCTQYFDAHTDAHNILHLLPWSSGHLLCFLAHHILVHRCIDAHKILRLLCFSAATVRTKYWCTENVMKNSQSVSLCVSVHKIFSCGWKRCIYRCTQNITPAYFVSVQLLCSRNISVHKILVSILVHIKCYDLLWTHNSQPASMVAAFCAAIVQNSRI